MFDVARLYDFRGKTALITGSSRGLGKAMAEGLAAAGAHVIISSRKAEACENLAEQLRSEGGKATAIAAHAGDIASIDRLIEQSLKQLQKIDILINNAAISISMGTLDQNDESIFDKMNDVNLKGPWYLASRLAPRMRDGGGGNIINVISVGGLKPGPGVGIYCANKAALHAMTKTMAQEWAPWKIRVNSLAPGPYETDMFASAANVVKGFREGSIASTTLKRVADPEEIIGSVLYLAGPASSYTTGTVLATDGGFLINN